MTDTELRRAFFSLAVIAGVIDVAGRLSMDALRSCPSLFMKVTAVTGRLVSSRRARSLSRRISTSIRHSTMRRISSSAYTRTPSLRPAMATSTPRCSITTTLLKGALRTNAYGWGAGGEMSGRTSNPCEWQRRR